MSFFFQQIYEHEKCKHVHRYKILSKFTSFLPFWHFDKEPPQAADKMRRFVLNSSSSGNIVLHLVTTLHLHMFVFVLTCHIMSLDLNVEAEITWDSLFYLEL